jgi:cation:H+ antiporter
VDAVIWVLVLVSGVGLIVSGSEAFAEHLSAASVRLGATAFALGLLLAGAEPEELATVMTASARDAPGIALGDVVGANVALSLVALGVGAWLMPIALPRRLRWYGVIGVALAVLAAAVAWDGRVGRLAGLLLVLAYAAYVAGIWWSEGRAPAIGEVEELEEAAAELAGEEPAPGARRRVGRELSLTVLGVAALALGSVVVVEAVKRITDVEEGQTRLGLTLVGFATAFELVVLAWSSARRADPTPLLAGVIGSFAYNSTMTLGAGALVRPLELADVTVLRPALVAMPLALTVPLAWSTVRALGRVAGATLVALYVGFVVVVLRS